MSVQALCSHLWSHESLPHFVTRTRILLTPFSPHLGKDVVTNNEPIANHLTVNKSLPHLKGAVKCDTLDQIRTLAREKPWQISQELKNREFPLLWGYVMVIPDQQVALTGKQVKPIWAAAGGGVFEWLGFVLQENPKI